MCSELYGDIQNFGIKSPKDNNQVRFTTPVTMRNEWTTLRKQYKVPGSTMLNKKLACGVPVVDKNGKKTVQNMWINNPRCPQVA